MIFQAQPADFPPEPRKTSGAVKSLRDEDFAADFPGPACKT